MVLYAFDGTWNEDEPGTTADTNVVKFRNLYQANGEKVEYVEGVGTKFGTLGRVLGGVFGAGGKSRIEEMYERLEGHWGRGRREIGFSRGAALAVHFANVIEEVGVAGEEVPEIRFLGLWDVVGSFGVPINFVLKFQDINPGYDLATPPLVAKCCHAMALDERRQTFRVTRQNRPNDRPNVEELWFRGVHSDVGGGNGNTSLSNISLKWMLQRAKNAGLPIKPQDISGVGATSRTAPLGENLDPIQNDKRIVYPADRFHPTARGKVLAKGESATFTARAGEQYSWSGIRLEAGKRYRIEPVAGAKWKDGGIECGPESWRSEDLPWYKEEFVELLEWRRRVPKANWFELIGSLGDDEDEFFRIGTGATFRASDEGELHAFPNDLRTMYANNAGSIRVSVTRL